MVKLVAADFTTDIREQSLGVTVSTLDELDIFLLSACLFPMRDKQLGP